MRIYNAGRFISPGAAIDSYVVFAEPNKKWQFPTNNVTLACLMRFNALPALDERIFGKYWESTKGGVKFVHVTSLGGYFKFGWSDGATEEYLLSTTIPSANITYLLIGIRSRSAAYFYVNGILESSNLACVVNAVASNAPISCFYDSTLAVPVLNAKIAMGGLWGRAMTVAEANRLEVDPYRMWNYKGLDAMGLPFSHGGCNCCPGWLGSFNDM